MPTLHVSTKAPEPKRVSVLPDAMRLPKPALEQRYPIFSSVFVKRSNGEETLAYVKECDAVLKECCAPRGDRAYSCNHDARLQRRGARGGSCVAMGLAPAHGGVQITVGLRVEHRRR
jgi:hypothetical protein